MNKVRIKYLRPAQRDLLEIRDYIRRDNPGAAEDWLDEVDKKISRLALFPLSGASPKDNRLVLLGYRMVVLGEYLAFYRYEGKSVEIHRVLNGRRRYNFLF